MATGISLHIGLNEVDPDHYEGWSGPLVACEADAQDMKAVAEERGFRARQLLTKEATRKAVTSALEDAARALVPGDLLFLTYAGHGGQVPDVNDDEPDGMDETWCLFDGQLIDDEIYASFAAFAPGVRIFVMSDSCHSGTVTRDVFYAAMRETGVLAAMTSGEGVGLPAARAMPASIALRVARRHRTFYAGVQTGIPKDVEQDIGAHVLLVSGCMDNQVSADGTFNGLFTGNFLRVWNKGSFRGNYRELHETIVARMPPIQTPNFFCVGPQSEEFEHQRPLTI